MVSSFHVVSFAIVVVSSLDPFPDGLPITLFRVKRFEMQMIQQSTAHISIAAMIRPCATI
jgi:hypothetical protein